MKAFFSIISFVFLFYYFPNIKSNFMYSDLIKQYKSSKSVAIIYDDFKTNHGPVDYKSFKTQLSKCPTCYENTDVITLDYNKVDYNSFFYILENMKAKKIYINISFAPVGNSDRDFMIYNIKKTARTHPDIYFFIAMGNNEYSKKDLSEFWKKINENGNVRNIIMRDPNISPYIFKTREMTKLFYFVFSYIFQLDKTEQIKQEIMKNTQKENVDEIYESIQDFMFTARLQNISNVFLVSGYDSFDIQKMAKTKKLNLTADMIGLEYSLKEYKNMDLKSSFLDCKINNLVVNKIRDVDAYYEKVENGYAPICGTSISSPIYMARYICSNYAQ